MIMFEPNFRYTDEIVNNLTQISVARELVLNSPLKEIAKLVELKIVELKGKGRGAHYVLV